jgi:hypothetical protein
MFFVPVIIFICVTVIHAQSLNVRIQQAVNDLSVRLNTSMDVSISSVIRDGVDTPSVFSRYVAGQISYYASNNDLFMVVASSRGMPLSRPTAARSGIISATYFILGDNVEVTLQLTSNNSIVNQTKFTVSMAELSGMGITIEPPNISAVQEREQVLERLNIPVAQDNSRPVPVQNTATQQAFELTAWPNTDTFTYIDGDEFKITLLSNRNCYFKVYHIDVNNQMQLIYPNAVNSNNYLPANQQRTIPEAPMQYIIQAPFGQDTILVVASTQQFTDIGAEIFNATRGIGMRIQELPNNQSATAETVSVRFSFTSLPATYYDNTFSYLRPANISDAIQSIRANVQQNGGIFNGNEREGTFTAGGTTGSYRVTADAIIFNIRYTGNQLATTARSAGFRFSIDRPQNMNETIQHVRTGIESSGGRFEGNEQRGSFNVKGIAGQYNVQDRVDIHITQKPFVIPNSMIEREVRNYFGGRELR